MLKERKEVLDMLKAGQITFEEAETLLEALEEKEVKPEIVTKNKPSSMRMLRILIESSDGDDVKVQVPLQFAKFLKIAKVDEKIKDQDIDFDQLIEMIENGVDGEIVNIKSADGDIVKIVVE